MKTEFFIYLLFFLQSSLYCIEEEEIIDLKDDKYNAIPTPNNSDIYYRYRVVMYIAMEKGCDDHGKE